MLRVVVETLSICIDNFGIVIVISIFLIFEGRSPGFPEQIVANISYKSFRLYTIMSISPRRYFKLNEGVMWISSIQPTQTQKNFRFGNNASY